MKRFITALVLAGASLMALASPTPKQVEQALAARDYPTAKSMISQVLAEHPSSARGHLLNAYVLIHVDHNKQAAITELQTAKNLDTKGDVKNSPLFGRVTAEIDMTRTQVAPQPVPTYTPPAPVQTYTQAPTPVPAQQAATQSGGHGFLIFVVLVLFGLVAWWVIRRMSSPTVVSETRYVPTPVPSGPPAPNYAYSGGYNGGTTYGGGMSTGAAMATGAVAGAVGAMAVENAIENSRLRRELDDERYRNRTYGGGYSAPTPTTYGTSTPAPAPDVPSVDYDTEAQSFSSGRDNDWEDRTPAPAPAPSYSSPFSSGRDDDDNSRSWSSPAPAPSYEPPAPSPSSDSFGGGGGGGDDSGW